MRQLIAGNWKMNCLSAEAVALAQAVAADTDGIDADLLVCPTAPGPAFPIGAKVDDPVTMYLNDIYTIGANLAGLPAMSIPCGFQSGLPVGLQLIGPHFSESRILSAAHAYQLETDWHQKLPAAYA